MDTVTATGTSSATGMLRPEPVVNCVSSRSGMQAQFTTSGVLRRLDVDERSLLM